MNEATGIRGGFSYQVGRKSPKILKITNMYGYEANSASI